MLGISYETWKSVCRMYFSLSARTQKSYLQWFPFYKLSKTDKEIVSGEQFFKQYIDSGAFVLFPELMRHSENYIQKGDGSFRDSVLVSPILFLVIQCLGKEVANQYVQERPSEIGVYYAGNYEYLQPKYKQDYDEFYKMINIYADQYPFFIKTDITSFFGNIRINELIARIDTICNKEHLVFSQTQLLLLKEILQFCGNGNYPLIESSVASSYLATVIYLDQIDCDLHRFIKTKVGDIIDFRMIRYVDDLYILFSSEKDFEELTPVYNSIRNEYSSILKEHGLALNARKCTIKESGDINEELKKSLYDEYVNGINAELCEFTEGKLKAFLSEILGKVREHGLTNEDYSELIGKCFKLSDIEYMPSEVYNYLVYENPTDIRTPDTSALLVEIIMTDVSFLATDPKRLAAMTIQSGNEKGVKAMLNQLFKRYRAGVWNSYDTTIAIAYLTQSEFRHIDLLEVLKAHSYDLYSYYYYNCRTSFIYQLRNKKCERIRRCMTDDKTASFLYFMYLCESNRGNLLGGYAYYKNYFDRLSADMAHKTGDDGGKKRPSYKGYYRKKQLNKLYRNIAGSETIIHKAHDLRDKNPLDHSTATLLDSSSSREIQEVQKDLEYLIDEYARVKNL